MNRSGRSLAIVVAAPLLLVGRAEQVPSAPLPSDSPSASDPAEPKPDPRPATLVVGAHDLTLLDVEGVTIETLPFSADGETAVTFLEEVFGEAPSLSAVPGNDHCRSAYSVAGWGDWFELAYDVQGESYTGLRMSVTSSEKTTPGGLDVLTASGFGAGDDVGALVAAQPDADTFEADFEGVAYTQVFYDVGAGTAADADTGVWWGATAEAEDGVIQNLRALVQFRDNC